MEKIKEKYFYPMAVAAVFGIKDTNEDIVERWDKFDLLDESEKNILISGNVPVAIKKIATHFILAPAEIEEISILIRETYFKNILKSNLSHELIRKIPFLTVENAQQIVKILDDEIFTLVLSSKEAVESDKKKLTYIQLGIFDALQKYTKLGEQNITSNQIKLRYFPTPVRPSIKNWITDFHDAMGAMKHSPIDRGNFLFHSENGKSLTATDRQKLGAILKSLDEQTLLTIDAESQVVLFQDNTDATPVSNGLKANRGFSSNPQQAQRVVEPPSTGSVGDLTFNAPAQKKVLPDIDLRQNQKVFGNSTAEPKKESNFSAQAFAQNQNQQSTAGRNTSYSPNFSVQSGDTGRMSNISMINKASLQGEAKPPIGGLASEVPGNFKKDTGYVLGSSAAENQRKTDAVTQSQNQPLAQEMQKEEKSESFFQIPQSKPPIGSEHFNGHQDPDLMSDESLYKRMQEKTVNRRVAAHDNDAGTSAVSFSSPQKLSVEQSTTERSTTSSARVLTPPQSGYEAQQQPAAKITNFPQTVPQRYEPSPYHIVPSDYTRSESADTEDGALPKIQKNIVDLKN